MDTVTPAKLLELADRCEREEPSDALDRAIAAACKIRWSSDEDGQFGGYNLLPRRVWFTRSLDAAVTLVPEKWTAWELRSHAARTRYSADLSRLTECDASQEDWAHGRASTPALALCAAALRARAALLELAGD